MINATIITPDDIRALVPGTPASINATDIAPYLRSAHKAVAAIVGADVFNEIAKLAQSELLTDMRIAIANRLMYDYKLFETIQLRQSGQGDVFKYELEAMQNTYLSFYFDALDSLFSGLCAEDCPVESWKTSEAFKTRENLLIKSTDEFSGYYGIDNSDYFFFSAIFCQRTVMDKYLSAIVMENLSADFVRRLKSIIARLTVAYALRQFDITMLPKCLRNSTADGAYRHASSEQESMYKLSDYLFNESERDLSQLLFELRAEQAGDNLPSQTNLNEPNKKFFLLT